MRTKIGKFVAMRSAAVAEKLVTWEETRTRSRMLAYRNVAAQIGRSGDWVRKLIARNVSRVDGEIERRLDALLVRKLEADIARLQSELDMARQCGAHPASQFMGEVEAHLAAARSLMEGETL